MILVLLSSCANDFIPIGIRDLVRKDKMADMFHVLKLLDSNLRI